MQAPDAVSLSDLLAGKSSAVESVCASMHEQGWLLLRNDDESLRQALLSLQCVQEWFEHGDKEAWRLHEGVFYNTMDEKALMGYAVALNKETFRMLTGSELAPDYIPPAFREQLTAAARQMDRTLEGILNVLCEPLFRRTVEQLCAEFNVPFCDKSPSEKKAPTKVGFWEKIRRRAAKDKTDADDSSSLAAGRKFAVLDCAYYLRNGASGPKKSLNCAAHFDPGLFSLSVFSSQPGLQMRDAAGHWCDVQPSPDCVVLWAGAVARKASDKRVVAAMHQVTAPKALPSSPRLSIWAEIPSIFQILPSGIPGMEDFQPAWNGPTSIEVQNVADKKVLRVRVENGGLMKALRTAEDVYGFPLVKMMFTIQPEEDGKISPWETGVVMGTRKKGQ